MRFLLYFVLLLLSPCCVAQALKVAVAANLQPVFEQLATAFKQESGIELTAAFNASGLFATQILNGAPYDLFLSADDSYPQKLFAAGLTQGRPRIYAYGTLILWSTQPGLNLDDWPQALAHSTGKIALADPKLAPYGREAVRVLTHYQLTDTLKTRLVYATNIGQTNQYIVSQSVDAGFTAKSAVLAPTMREVGHWIDIDPAAYQPIAQAMVVLKNAPASANRFSDFMQSDTARLILAQYGYRRP